MSEFRAAQVEYNNYYQMMSDGVRMQAFHTAIKRSIKPGDVVIDLGAGTGILGIWALQAGAKKVYAIEKTEAIELAREIARVNGYLDRIEFIQDNSMNVSLPQRADAIISETIGSFAVDENMMQYMVDARERMLVDGGVLIPNALNIFAAPVDSKGVYDKIDFWRKFSNVDFSPAFELFSHKMMVESILTDHLLAEPLRLQPVDLNTWKGDSYMARNYFPIQRTGTIHGMAGWFTVTLCDDVQINTAPDQPETHWKQAFFPFRDPIRVVQGDVLDWSVVVAGTSSGSDHTHISYQYRCTQMREEIRAERIGRNDPCPCGSGLKSKKCCGRMDGDSCNGI
ncbi:MAG: 50S ribosomal protein L11 methyltransferase [Mariprofundaceae bacterium]|nr:50S ribosomal protein L11 methyltransferase [Mariprofundaceae bacterium]